jgi:hypothetical protein
MSASQMYIDIPDGEKYGFPKKYEYREGESLRDWLISNGCPKTVLTPEFFPIIMSSMSERGPKQLSFNFDGDPKFGENRS